MEFILLEMHRAWVHLPFTLTMRLFIIYQALRGGPRRLVVCQLFYGIHRRRLVMPASACGQIVLASTSPAAVIWSSWWTAAQILLIGRRCKPKRLSAAKPISAIRSGGIIPAASTAS